MEFTPDHRPPRDRTETDLWFVFQNGRLLVDATGARPSIPVSGELSAAHPRGLDGVYLVRLATTHCFAQDLPEAPAFPSGFALREFRPVLDELPSAHAAVALRAAHIVHWRRTQRYCGHCGASLVDCEEERARRCTACDIEERCKRCTYT